MYVQWCSHIYTEGLRQWLCILVPRHIWSTYVTKFQFAYKQLWLINALNFNDSGPPSSTMPLRQHEKHKSHQCRSLWQYIPHPWRITNVTPPSKINIYGRLASNSICVPLLRMNFPGHSDTKKNCPSHFIVSTFELSVKFENPMT